MSDQDRLEETRDVLRRMNEDPFYQNAAKKDLLAAKLTGDEENKGVDQNFFGVLIDFDS